MSGPVIVLNRIGVTLDRSLILDEITLVVAQGERVAIVGNNGAGKSTLLKLLAGSISPVRGTISVLGQNLRAPLPSPALRRLQLQIGQVFQALQLVPRLTVLENVLIGSLSRHRTIRSWARIFPLVEIERAEAALQAVGLEGYNHVRADRLSGGERQKTAIARMLIQQPRLILVDEPTSALDPVASSRISVMLSALAEKNGLTMVTVVHDPAILPLVANRVIGLSEKRVAFDLPTAGVTSELLNAFYGDANACKIVDA
ncbi:MAG: phosphonate ABC transporter ATP-binding protein [Burkholderiaceae bacterium]